MAAADIAMLRDRARTLLDAGDIAGARSVYAGALRRYPHDPGLLNSAGNFHAGQGDLDEALTLFERAILNAPDDAELIMNRCVVLSRMARASEALPSLLRLERRMAHIARYWSVRASLEKTLDDKNAAAASYDRCLALHPTHLQARHGRARLALERGELDAVARFEAALAGQQGDAQLWLGYAQALDCAGQSSRALEIGRALARQAPGWTDLLQFLAELRWALGDRDNFCADFAESARLRPDDCGLIKAWCAALAGVDRHAEAADIAGDAVRRFSGDETWRLAEAVYAGASGDDDRAERLFADLPLKGPERAVQEARHRLRRMEAESAERLLNDAIGQNPTEVAAWALRDIAWRLLGDSRSEWLHRQEGLVQFVNTGIAPNALAEIVSLMHRLHDTGSMPLGQSIRSGTQTQGGLFDRLEPEVRLVHAHIVEMIERYRSALPPVDPEHPLLRHRDHQWRIKGSWSIRARAGGHHSAHIHPHGLLSSAFYLILPPTAGGSDALGGALELGRPPPDLRLDLPPIAVIEPVAGHCALFPSTLYHGTRPFSAGQRMTIAFDVTLAA
ncbi:tetratricopeptide repeat protein [Sphingobium yanoikuyae]|uniref:tetratricopeptide repeat protein n=1 Tax=Sphingobium yanoikuyae TaxID=13690 RepID=UPI000C0F7631|nr:MAG: hypothetical protein COC10_07910 [Sphingobium sp.]